MTLLPVLLYKVYSSLMIHQIPNSDLIYNVHVVGIVKTTSP